MYRECITCNDISLVPRHSEIKSRDNCCINSSRFSMPIIASPMDTVYSRDLDNLLTQQYIPVVVHRYFKDAFYQHSMALKTHPTCRYYAVGSIYGQHETEWIDYLIDAGIHLFCVDMAHGDTKACVDTVTYIKSKCEINEVIAGNVATRSAFRRLEDAGADMIRVGIGSGSICSTRLNTGFGVPLLSSLEDCASVRENALIIADGGMRYPGDITKAIAFGADLCMLGRQLASTNLAPGKMYDKDKNQVGKCEDAAYKQYRGMASRQARENVMKNASIEGVSGLIPYTGTTEQYIEDLKMNLKASLSYAGCMTWKEFRRDVKKIRISPSSWNESLTHVE